MLYFFQGLLAVLTQVSIPRATFLQAVKTVPPALLKQGSKGEALQDSLAYMVGLACKAEEDQRLLDAHTLAKFDEARPIVAAGLYSSSQECQCKIPKT